MRRLSIVLTLAAGGLVAAQSPPAPAPIFRSGTDVVEVDVQVVDKIGRPVANLDPGDFTLLVDNQPRAISTVDLLTYEAGPGAAGAAPPPPIPPSSRWPPPRTRATLARCRGVCS